MITFNIFDNDCRIIGEIQAPSGDIAWTLAKQKHPDKAYVYVIQKPTEDLYLRSVFAAVIGKELTSNPKSL